MTGKRGLVANLFGRLGATAALGAQTKSLARLLRQMEQTPQTRMLKGGEESKQHSTNSQERK